MEPSPKNYKSQTILSLVVILLLLSLLVFLFIDRNNKKNLNESVILEKRDLQIENVNLKNDLIKSETLYNELNNSFTILNDKLKDTEKDLEREQERNEEFEDQIRRLSGTVKDLDKLSKTDEEILQKYSRTYFLNENFIPMKLTKINNRYVMPDKKDLYFHGNAVEFLEDMLDDAKEAGYDIRIISAYRSFDEQTALKGQYTQIYGSGSNAFSADQGYSEHQLGTTVDIVDINTRVTTNSFAETEAYKWLQDNAYRYGFILSYPEDNGFYIFEPWHWRFVGVDLARDLHRQNAKFYEWDQRKIDEYLIKVFD